MDHKLKEVDAVNSYVAKSDWGFFAAMLGVVTLIVGVPAAWLTHVIYCLIHAKYLLLIAGGFIFPIGVIHGIGIWLGMGW